MSNSATLTSFAPGARAVVIGASGGLGAAIVRALLSNPAIGSVVALSRSGVEMTGAECGPIDLTDEASVVAAAARVAAGGAPDLVLVAAGLLHDGETMAPEKSLRVLNPENMARSLAVNAIGPALAAKHFLPLLPRGRKAVFAALSARVGSISDNRLGGWVSYRASKAALNQILRTAAVELTRTRPEAVIVGLHPGTVDTHLSAPFQANVPEGKLFAPDDSARRLLAVLDGLTPERSGCVFDYAGAEVPA